VSSLLRNKKKEKNGSGRDPAMAAESGAKTKNEFHKDGKKDPCTYLTLSALLRQLVQLNLIQRR